MEVLILGTAFQGDRTFRPILLHEGDDGIEPSERHVLLERRNGHREFALVRVRAEQACGIELTRSPCASVRLRGQHTSVAQRTLFVDSHLLHAVGLERAQVVAPVISTQRREVHVDDVIGLEEQLLDALGWHGVQGGPAQQEGLADRAVVHLRN